jgi:hypothetical protein
VTVTAPPAVNVTAGAEISPLTVRVLLEPAYTPAAAEYPAVKEAVPLVAVMVEPALVRIDPLAVRATVDPVMVRAQSHCCAVGVLSEPPALTSTTPAALT